MPLKRKTAKVFLCLALSMAAWVGVPMDPKQIEENLQIMNQTQVEVVVPEKKSGPGPDLDDWLLPDPSDPKRVSPNGF